jgi:uncharacterized protein (TIGR03118 family)
MAKPGRLALAVKPTLLACLIGAASCVYWPMRAAADHDHYQQLNLVSDLPGVAILQDTNLVNAWGMSFSSSSPFWVSDNGKGLATLYTVTNDSQGMVHVVKVGLEVTIPGDGNPTGQFFNTLNTSGAFNGDLFIFVSEDGTISGWRPALVATAEVLVPGITNNVYKGTTLVTNSSIGPVLLAANFRAGTVDVYGTNSMLSNQLSDASVPSGYAPFNVQSIGDLVFVTFAKQDEFKHDDAPGKGHGLIDVLDPMTWMFHRFATGKDAGGKLKQINSPWGVAMSPKSFGAHGDKLLVGNFGSGTIMVFDEHGHFKDFIEGAHEKPIVIDGLWGLAFGNGGRAGTPDELFFTAGPNGESDGLFGRITPLENKHQHHDQGEDENKQ